MQEDLPTSSGIDLMTWLNFEAAITRNPRVAQSLRDMTRTAEVVLTTPHLQIEQRENARADMAESVRYCKQLMQLI